MRSVCFGAFCGLFFMVRVFAAIVVTDDEGKTVSLAQPAQRVVSLSPHATEMLYAIGAAEELVGVTRYSEYPEQAKSLPVVGDFRQIDLEKVLVLKPDLIVVGIAVFYSNPRRLADIPGNMVRLGMLTGHEDQARRVAGQWNGRLDRLKRRYRNRAGLRVFYQVSDVPLFTLNGKQIVSEVIDLCGGKNVFADIPVLAPHVSTEAVLAANPEVIVSTRGMGTENGLSGWRRYKMLDAVRYRNLFHMNPDWLDRSGPRMIQGAEMMCRQLDEARKNRQAARP